MARPKINQSVRLNKFLADAGICSRRKADELIAEGRVKVNGQICFEMGVKINPADDSVIYKGKRVKVSTDKVYLAFNKPKNVVTTTADPEGRMSVMDYFKKTPLRIFPVGRLDWATEGLLLLTNDGDFSHEVTSPKSKIPKTYLAKLNGRPTHEQLRKLETGVTIAGGRVKAIKATLAQHGDSKKYDWVQITIDEGKNRQIRKMFEKIGFDVKKLQRISIGELKLGALKPGQFRELKADDLRRIFKLSAEERSEKRAAIEAKYPAKKTGSRKKPLKKTTQRNRSVKK